MAKRTLSTDERVIQRAKKRARATSMPPSVLQRLRGSLKSVDPADYRRYLERKYR